VSPTQNKSEERILKKENVFSFSPKDLVITLILKFIAIGFIHEFGHLLTLLLLGGSGYISADWFSLYTISTNPMTHSSMTIVAYAGGLLAAFFCLTSLFFEDDEEDRIAWRVIGWVQFSYGLTEGTIYFFDWLWKYNIYFFIASMIIGVIWGFKTSKELWENERLKYSSSQRGD